jgi:hypothetical protein
MTVAVNTATEYPSKHEEITCTFLTVTVAILLVPTLVHRIVINPWKSIIFVVAKQNKP